MKRRALLGRALLGAAALSGTVSRALSAAAPAPDAGAGTAAAARADVDLVLAIDLSASITKGTLAFELRGHAAAFRDPRVQNAIASGPAGAVTVTLAGFGGPGTARALLARRRIAGAADAGAFADAIDALEVDGPASSTAIGSAMIQLLPLFDRAATARARDTGRAAGMAPRRVLDIVSNGFSNAGIEPALARPVLAEAGVTVNALAILDEYDWLETYFRDQVIAGPGAFVRTVEGPEGFARALVQKLVQEIV